MNGKHAAEIAKGKAKQPGWMPYLWNVVGDGAGLLITGAIPLDDPPQRGRWKQPPEQVLVSADELRAWEHHYEVETGKCSVCDGSGQVWNGYNIETGHRYRTCSRVGCDGGTLRVKP